MHLAFLASQSSGTKGLSLSGPCIRRFSLLRRDEGSMCIIKTYKTRGRRRWRGRDWECRSGELLGKGQSCREEGEPGTVVSARCSSPWSGLPGEPISRSGAFSPFGAVVLWGLPWADGKAALSGLRSRLRP